MTIRAADVAQAILAARVGSDVTSFDGSLIKALGGWSRWPDEVSEANLADVEAWRAALGPHTHATLTADGRGARVDSWCRCVRKADGDAWVRYERWSARGREAHGFLCPACRFLTQTG